MANDTVKQLERLNQARSSNHQLSKPLNATDMCSPPKSLAVKRRVGKNSCLSASQIKGENY